jgi:hypothetical protein
MRLARHVACMGEKRKPREGENLEYLGVDGKIIFNRILKK